MHVRVVVLVFPILASSLLLAQSSINPSMQSSMSGLALPGAMDGHPNIENIGSVSGTVSTLDGRPIHDVQVELHDVNTGSVILSAYSKSNGEFEFSNLPVGQYEVVATRGVDQAHERVRIDRGPSQVSLRLNAPVAEPGSGDTVSVAALKVPDKAQAEYRKAQEDFQKSHFDDAEKHNEKALALVPNYAQALTMRGLLKMDKGDFPGGTEAFQAAIHADPNYPLAYIAMGAALNIAGHYSDAQKSLEQGLKIQPTSWQAYFELGKAVLGQHDFRNALKYCVKSESLGGIYPPIHLVKAHALLGLKDYDEAASELEQYLAKDSKGPKAEEARRALDQAKAFSATAEK